MAHRSRALCPLAASILLVACFSIHHTFSHAVGPWPLVTGFETPDYSPGTLDGQNGWTSDASTTIQNSVYYNGAQAVLLTSQTMASYTPASVSDDIYWIDVACKAQPGDTYPDLPATAGSSCVLFFHEVDGITCLDGDGVGSGTWVTTNIQADTWKTVGIRQDYASNTWDLYVDGSPVLSGLGNAYNTSSFSEFECLAGDAGPVYLDDFFSHAFSAQSDIWVYFDQTDRELGTEAYPFRTLEQGLDWVTSGGTVSLKPSTSYATPRITQPVRLEAPNGGVRIGG